MAGRKRVSIKERFLEKVAIRKDGCWYWTAFCMKNGYGLFRFPEGHKLAHRVSYELFNGPLDPKLDVMHTCDVPCCVNPQHLVLGTRTDNMQDASIKGRMAHGERHGRAKITEEQARAILSDTRLHKTIALDYGVSQTTVWEIKSGRKWAHLQALKFN